jgi:hypothetical protein
MPEGSAPHFRGLYSRVQNRKYESLLISESANALKFIAPLKGIEHRT